MLTPAPSTVTTADDLLALARTLVDEAVDALAASPGVEVSCRAGCSACCQQLVPVSAAELRGIHAAVAALPPDQAAAVRDRIESAASELRAQGFTSTVDWDLDLEERLRLSRRYFAAQVKCPLLEDGLCSIRPARPLVCREYIVTSDPAHCATLDRGATVRIRSSRDLLAGFAQVSAALADRDRFVLALALDEHVPEPPDNPPKSGVSAVQLLTSVGLDVPGEGPA